MKLKTIVFKKPVTVLQIFRNIYEYGKEQKSLDDRRELAQWKTISSKSGYIKDNELYLPEEVVTEPHFTNCTLLTLEDNNNAFHHTLPNIYPQKNNRCFQQAQTIKLDIFNLHINEKMELELDYGYFEIGIPERPNILLGLLEPQQPVEIKINGKTDASLTSRRERTFKEQHYIYQHLGTFNACYLLNQQAQPVVKNIPEPVRTINLLKPLW